MAGEGYQVTKSLAAEKAAIKRVTAEIQKLTARTNAATSAIRSWRFKYMAWKNRVTITDHKNIEDEITQSSNDTDELSAATINEVARLDGRIDNETTRAIAAEESISGIVNTFSATTESTIRDLQKQLTEANSIIKTLKTEIQTLSGVVETIESQMAENIYSTVKAILQGASRQIKVTPDDTNKQITIGFSDDAIFGQ